MRINILAGIDADGSNLTQLTAEMLKAQLGAMGVEITDCNPDVIHIIGGWNKHCNTIAQTAVERTIPVVYTPVGAISEWLDKKINMDIPKLVTIITVGGELEKRYIRKIYPDSAMRTVWNANVTSLTNAERMASEYHDIYLKEWRYMEDYIWKKVKEEVKVQEIDNDDINDILTTTLYIQAMIKRCNLPQRMLQTLAEQLHKGDYDEDFFMEVVQDMNIEQLFARLEQILLTKEMITEGFTPIPALQDAMTEKIMKLITYYPIIKQDEKS